MNRQQAMSRRVLKRNSITGYLYISPWIAGFLLFTALPLLYSLYLSFQQVKITTNGIETKFVRLQNYEYAFVVDVSFIQMLLKFLQELAISVPIILVFSVIIALLLNQPIRFRGLFRTVFFLPVIIASGPVINQLIEQGVTTIPGLGQYTIYQAVSANRDGFLNGILVYLMENLIMILWFSGVQILIFLAGIQKIDRQVYEAARIDGASKWEIFWKITLPSLFPMILVNTVYTIVIYSVFSLNPIIVHIQKNMFKLDTGFGYASALSWIYFVAISLTLAVTVAFLNWRGKNKHA